MKSVAILKHDADFGQKGRISGIYDGPPDQSKVAREESHIHVEIPEGIDHRALTVSWDENDQPVIGQDNEKLAQVIADEQKAAIEKVLSDAIGFGNKLIKEITLENMALGITQAGKTGQVRKALTEALLALQTGSLYDAIIELKAIPAEAKDEVFVTDARLLQAVNKIEAYLGLGLSESL